jgi:hypothetical protein
MKEATGELNMTAITLVAIGAILAFFYLFIWPSIQTGLALNTACSIAGMGEYSDDENGISCVDGTCTVEDSGQSKSCIDAANSDY